MVKAKQTGPEVERLLKENSRFRKRLRDKEWAARKTNECIRVLYRELEGKNIRLKEMDKLKSQFVANVSHEFKNPLGTIKECFAVLLDQVPGRINSRQKEVILGGRKVVERLIRLVSDLLDLSKIESGKMEIRREILDIASLVKETLAECEGEFSRKGICLKREIAENTGFIWADKDKIEEVIINLLNNAAKYTPEKGQVCVELTGSRDLVCFVVSDSGPGIPEDCHGKIFDKFERIASDRQEGTGLGLPIAKDIVELHKGRIWVDSRIGEGSKFIFVLPRDLRLAESNSRG